MVAFRILLSNMLIFRQKKPGHGPALWIHRLCLNETRRVGKRYLGALYVTECLANDLLGDAGALAALGCDACRFTYFTVATAAFVDGIANLAVGYTLAKTDIHEHYPLSSLLVAMLIIMRIIVKARSSPRAISSACGSWRQWMVGLGDNARRVVSPFSKVWLTHCVTFRKNYM
jgi:hypothetical protein